MASTTALGRLLRFGAFELNVATRELRKFGLRVKLRPQAAKVLVLLASRNAETVTREQLRDEIWGSTLFIDFEHGLNLCIRQIRAALDDDADKPRYVETIPRSGYRFIARVEEVATPLPVVVQPAPTEGADGSATRPDVRDEYGAVIPYPPVQSASDPAFARGVSDARTSAPLAGQSSGGGNASFWPRAAMLSAAGVVFAAVLSFVLLRPRSALVPATDWVQITNFADSVTAPAFSPDGRLLTFLRGTDTFVTAGQLYVMLLPHGNPVQLTNDSSPKMSPVFSPDGSSIDYTVPWDTWTVPVLGGRPRLRLPNASGLTWLDTDNVTFSQIISGIHMGVASSGLSRVHMHSVYTPESSLGMAHRSYLSPDRKWVIVVEMTGMFWDRFYRIPLR